MGEADILNNDGWNGLMLASFNGLKRVVEAILSKPELKEKVIRKQDKYGDTSFMIACRNGHEEIALLLLDEVDIANNEGRNGFMYACSKGLIKVVEAILSKPELREKILKKQDNRGETTFMIAL